MSPHVGTVHCLILTHSTWELLWSCVAVLLVSCLTWNRYLMQCWHFIILWFFWWLSKILLFLVEKLPSVTSWFVTFTRTSWTLAYSITRAGRGNWMTIHVRAGQDICLDVNSLLCLESPGATRSCSWHGRWWRGPSWHLTPWTDTPPPYPWVWTQHLYTPGRHGRRNMHFLIGKQVLGLCPSVTNAVIRYIILFKSVFCWINLIICLFVLLESFRFWS